MKTEQSLGDISRDDQKALAELDAKRLEVEANITEQRIEFRNKIAEFDKAQRAAEEAILDNIKNLRIERMKEGADKEIEQINLDSERKMEAVTGSEEQIIEQLSHLRDIREQAIQAVRDKYADEEAEKDKKAKEAQLKRDNELADEQKRIAQERADFEAMLKQSEQDAAFGAFQLGVDLSAKAVKNEKAARQSVRQEAAGQASALEQIQLLLGQSIAATNDRFDRIQVQNNLSNVDSGLRTINKIKSDADV